ncbi:MAG: hypothetical protein A2234_11400 [Elusimicrobia bacterium RIFOXYA2_FULL_58_8]|nr:MAG: hypothetical protein A2285_00775 [Elusimicrobia bacterium RIFOXYA12_FULL_57_11]OGS14502.1 MAG: hypothetical protein A2234_11400 [Elusimicrobia bacterium RIFOXYA2_FULL_58_8]
MKLEVRNVSIGSLVTSSVPLVLFVLALLGGAVKFFLVPDPQLAAMTFLEKLMSVGLFSLLYVVITSAVLVFAAFAYNIFSSVLGLRGFTLDIEEVHDHE